VTFVRCPIHGIAYDAEREECPAYAGFALRPIARLEGGVTATGCALRSGNSSMRMALAGIDMAVEGADGRSLRPVRTEVMRARTNSEWVREMSAGGEEQAAALGSCGLNWCEPHATRCTAASGGWRTSRRSTSTKLAQDCAQDALLTIFAYLTDFRGDSRFTTLVYKFAIDMALAAARRDVAGLRRRIHRCAWAGGCGHAISQARGSGARRPFMVTTLDRWPLHFCVPLKECPGSGQRKDPGSAFYRSAPGPSPKSEGTNVWGSAGSVRSACCRGVSWTSGGGSTRARDQAIWETQYL
jgi:hypothetical protein